MSQEEDIQLMDAFKSARPQAEKAVFERFYRPLCLYAAEITRDVPQAEDIVTEALKKAFDRRNEFDGLLNFRSFVYRVVKNASLNGKDQRLNRASIIEKIRFEQGQHAEVVDPKEYEMLRVELLDKIFQEVAGLPAQCRIIFERLFIKGESTDKIANDLHLSINTVRAQKGRAIKLLKTRLLKNGDTDALALLAILLLPVK